AADGRRPLRAAPLVAPGRRVDAALHAQRDVPQLPARPLRGDPGRAARRAARGRAARRAAPLGGVGGRAAPLRLRRPGVALPALLPRDPADRRGDVVDPPVARRGGALRGRRTAAQLPRLPAGAPRARPGGVAESRIEGRPPSRGRPFATPAYFSDRPSRATR